MTEPSTNASSEILVEERKQIATSRRSQDESLPEDVTNLIGLALSSGGIRSGCFCFGVLQGLARAELLRGIDYLSCVGGGGYAGGWLATKITRKGFEETRRTLRDTKSRLPAPRIHPLLSTIILTYLPAVIAILFASWAATKGYKTGKVNWVWIAGSIYGAAIGAAQLFNPVFKAWPFLTRRYVREVLEGDIPLNELGKTVPYPIFVAATADQTPFVFSPLFSGRPGHSERKDSFATAAEAITISGPLPDTGEIRVPNRLKRILSFDRRPLEGRVFDSLGVYELIRRGCRFIMTCDGTSDPNSTFEGLGNVIRKCRRDFGVEIEFSVAPLNPTEEGRARKHYQMGAIRFPDGKPGLLLCFKPVLTGDEPADLIQYAKAHPQFPSSEVRIAKFEDDELESYRQLGLHTVESLMEEIRTSARWAKMPMDEIVRDIRRQLRPDLEVRDADAPTARSEVAIPDDLINAIVSGECILCTGAGLAAQAKLPTWPILFEGLLAFARKRSLFDEPQAAELSVAIAAGDLEEVGDELAHRIREQDVAAYLREALPETAQPSPAHRLLAEMPFRGALNTSLDSLVALSFGLRQLLSSDAPQLVASLPSKAKFAVNLSGSPGQPDSIVLNSHQFRAELLTNPQYKQFLGNLFLEYHTLFVGSSIDGIRGFLDALGLSKPPGRRQFALIAREGQVDPVKARYLERTYNLQVLEYEPGFEYAGFSDYLDRLKRALLRKARPVQTSADSPTLQNMTLENIGPFESISIDFTSGWNLLLGDNGKGKTILLRAIAVGLCGEEAEPTLASRLLRSGRDRGTISLRINNRDYTTELMRKNDKVQIKTAGLSPIQTNRWLVIGFPALRSVPWDNPAGPENSSPRKPSVEDMLPLLRGLPDARVSSLKQWLVNLDYARQRTVIEDFFKALRNLIPGVRIGDYSIDSITMEIRIQSDGGEVPLSAISQGTGSVMCWIGTLLQRMRETEVASHEHPLVLIDEIDAHMHPRWQQVFVEAFRNQFPSVQVIATSHSPLMVGSLNQNEIWLVRRSPLKSEIYGIAQVKGQKDGTTEVIVRGPEPEDEEGASPSPQQERKYVVPSGIRVRVQDGQIVEANEALTADDVNVIAERLNIPPEGWRVDQILTLPYFGLDRTRDAKTTELINAYTRESTSSNPDQNKLGELAAKLQVRAPSPHETAAAREAFDIIKDFAHEKVKKLSPAEREKVLTEVKAQFAEGITGSRRPV